MIINLDDTYSSDNSFRLLAKDEKDLILGEYLVFATQIHFKDVYLSSKITSFESGKGIPRKLIGNLQEILIQYSKINNVCYHHNVFIKKDNSNAIKKLPRIYQDVGYKFEEDKKFLIYIKEFK